MKEEHLSFCHVCPSHCSRKFTVEDGKIVDVDRDLKSGFPSEWCTFTRARTIKEVCDHPDRLRYPLKRVGPRGAGQWERISWDEALDTIAERLKGFKEKYGPESLTMCLGEPKGMEFAFAQRFASRFGTPNVITPGNF